MTAGARRVGLALLLKQTEHRIQRRLAPQLDELGLSMEHWRVMSVLGAEPGIAMAVLADAAVLPSASLTRHVDRLVERGMIVRHVDPADRRRVVAALSPVGRVVADRLRAQEDEIESELRGELGDDRFRALADELTLLGRPG